MATHSSILAWRIPGTVEPGGLPSVGLHRVGHDWSNLAAAAGLVGSLGKWEAINDWCRYWLQGRPMVCGSFWASFASSLSLAFFVCSSTHNRTWLPQAQCYLTLQGQIWKWLAFYNMSVGMTIANPNTLTPGLVTYAEFSFLNVSTDGGRN